MFIPGPLFQRQKQQKGVKQRTMQVSSLMETLPQEEN